MLRTLDDSGPQGWPDLRGGRQRNYPEVYYSTILNYVLWGKGHANNMFSPLIYFNPSLA